jgi:hypothetical protein
MDESVAVRPEERAAELRECEAQIRKACLRGRDLTREIARNLIRIKDRELWRAVKEERGIECRDFSDYVREWLMWEPRAVQRYMEAEATFRLLEKAKLPQLPFNESQALELARLDEELQPVVWSRILDLSEREALPITASLVRDAVAQEQENQHEAELEREAQARRDAKSGVKVDMDGDDDQLSLSERGEEALARIGALCGKDVQEAILSKDIKITEDSVRKWGEQEDPETVRGLAQYVVEKGWTVRKSLNYMSKLVDGDTTIDELILMARERKGRLSVMHDDARLIIEIMMLKSSA